MLDPQEERTKFISLREALFLIAQAKGKTAQEAAQMLLLNLNNATGWMDLKSVRYSPALGMLSNDKIQHELHCRLIRLAEYNDHNPGADDEVPF